MTRLLCFALLASPLLADDKPFLYEWQHRQLTEDFFGEDSAAGDLDGDGHTDIVYGPMWYAGPDFERKFLLKPGDPFKVAGYSDSFFSWVHDVDADGDADVVRVQFPGKPAVWLENPGVTAEKRDGRWHEHVILPECDNESPAFTDINGDGTPELVCGYKGSYGYASPGREVMGPWIWTPVTGPVGVQRFTHGLGVGDIDGDGRADLITSKAWYAQTDGGLWTKRDADFGEGGAQMLVDDVNGDGRADVITSIRAHGYGLAWFEQADDFRFVRHDITTDNTADSRFGVAVSQMHGLALADINGDGLNDVVTGKRWWAHNGHDPGTADPAALYWFRLTRDNGRVEYVPEPIHGDSGVGTEVSVADLDGDGLLDVLAGNKKGLNIHVQGRRNVNNHEWFWGNHPSLKAFGKTPSQTVAGMQLPDGFQANIYAAEPDLQQPIAVAFDAKGRLWVVENTSYPNWAPEGNDRIVIFEDTDGDGTHDTRKVFTEGLNFATGLEVGYGGVFVGSPPNLLFIPDADGDDVPDGEPVVLLDGWGHDDTHETINSFRWGPDGWLYGCQGVFTNSLVGKPGTSPEDREPLNGAVWRYHPTRHTFEVFAHGTSNPWGVDFDATGEAFITCCVIPHLFHLSPGGRYMRQAGQHFNPHTYADIQPICDHRHTAGNGIRDFAAKENDLSGGGHAHAGCLIYDGANWPEEYRGRILMNNIHGNRVNMDTFERQGSGFVGSHLPDFLMAGDQWYRGLGLRLGPDGAVYINDWYDARACHQQRPSDRSNGRVYRVAYGETAETTRNLTVLSDGELAALCAHPNGWQRETSRRLLAERAAAGAIDTEAVLVAVDAAMEAGDATVELSALWHSHAAGILDESEYVELMAPGTPPEQQKWAVRLAAELFPASPAVQQAMADAAESDSPAVRLAVAASLSRLPVGDRWNVAEKLAVNEADIGDPNIPLMTWYAIEPSVAADPRRGFELAVRTVWPRVTNFILRRIAAEPQNHAMLADLLPQGTDRQRLLMLEAMREAMTDRPRWPEPAGWDGAFAALSSSENGRVRTLAMDAALKYGSADALSLLRKTAADADAPLPERVEAVRKLASVADAASVPTLHPLLRDADLQAPTLDALAVVSDANTPGEVLSAYPELRPENRGRAVGILMAQRSSAAALLDAVAEGRVEKADLSSARLQEFAKFKDDALTDRVMELFGIVQSVPAEKQRQIEDWRKRLGPADLANANAVHGRQLFAKHCASCHKLFGEGHEIGPELTGANRRNADYLLQNIITPSAVIGRDYQTTVLILDDGRVLSGLVREETENSLKLQTADALIPVDKSRIEERELSEKSLMPDGLFDRISDADVKDLFRYLAADGQVPLPE